MVLVFSYLFLKVVIVGFDNLVSVALGSIAVIRSNSEIQAAIVPVYQISFMSSSAVTA